MLVCLDKIQYIWIPILGTSAVMDQTACYYNVTTSETGLYFSYKVCSIMYHTTIWIVYSNSGYFRHYGPDSLL